MFNKVNIGLASRNNTNIMAVRQILSRRISVSMQLVKTSFCLQKIIREK